MQKHIILFLAANPSDTDRLALDREAHAIQVELERGGYRSDERRLRRAARCASSGLLRIERHACAHTGARKLMTSAKTKHSVLRQRHMTPTPGVRYWSHIGDGHQKTRRR